MPNNHTQVAPTQRSDSTEARIFQLILKGQLKATSSISKDGDAKPVLLADHPEFSKVLELAQIARSVGVLRNVKWWHEREAAWSTTLQLKSLGQVLFDLSCSHDTGFLTLSRNDEIKVIAVSAGNPVCINSNPLREQLSAQALAQSLLDQQGLNAVLEHTGNDRKLFEWGLLEHGISVDDLLQLRKQQAQVRLFDLFSWEEGDIAFQSDDRAAQLHTVIDDALPSILRKGVWGQSGVSCDALMAVCDPIWDGGAKLKILRPFGGAEENLTPGEHTVLAAARDEMDPMDLRTRLQESDDQARLSGLRFLYLYTQLGFMGLDMPHYAQPMLSELHLLSNAADETNDTGLDTDHPDAQPRKRVQTSTAQLSEYRLQVQLDEEARRLLNGKQWSEACDKFRQLVDRQDKPSNAVAYLAVATMLAKGAGWRQRSSEYATKAIAIDVHNPIAHAAMYRILQMQGNHAKADRHLKRAQGLSSYSDPLYAEVNGLAEVGAKKKRAKEDSGGFYAATLAGVVFVVLFAVSNLGQSGAHEYYYDGSDLFFYIRRGVLLVAGLMGVKMVSKCHFWQVFHELGWSINGKAIAYAVLWGSVVGFFSPSQRVTGQIAVVLVLTLLHVLSEEVFFRSFLTRALQNQYNNWLQAVFVSALIFGAYHFTYSSFWFDANIKMRFYWTTMIAVFAGGPYALMFLRGGGFIPAFICHLLINSAMMTLSIYGAGWGLK